MLLTLVTFLPTIFALLLCAIPAFLPASMGSAPPANPRMGWVRPVSLVFALIEFVVSMVILAHFNPSSAALQMSINQSWIPEFGISYFLGIDGLSLWLVMLTTFLTPLVILASWNSIDKKPIGFHASIFVLQTSMIGSFLAMDAILFYVFFELSLVPMYFMIGIWGGTRRIYATVKFFIYTMFGSLMMLLAIIYLMFAARDTVGQFTANLLVLYQLKLPFIAGELMNPQTLLFFAFSLAFAIKVPMFPVHTWLPDAHVEAPTPGSVILAGVMLKMGSYGFLRFVIPLFPEASEHFAWVFLFLGVIGIIYGALVAMVQPDIKKLVAYSSVSHMGYVMIGLFAMNIYGVTGSLYQMLNHGVSTGALFLLVGMIYERTHSREIEKYGGLAKALPIFTIVFFIVTMSSIAVPMTNGFVGEFMILLGTFAVSKALAIAAVSGVVLGAVYMLWMVKRVFFGQPGELVRDEHHPLQDLSLREMVVMAPLIVLIFWMGLFPNHFLDWSKSSLNYYVTNKDNYQLEVAEHSQKPASPFVLQAKELAKEPARETIEKISVNLLGETR